MVHVILKKCSSAFAAMKVDSVTTQLKKDLKFLERG